MPKGPVQTPITDQEIAFAHLVLAGTMTDKTAAKVVGIDPSRAAYVKAKPKVQAYMEEHRASVRAGLVQHEVDALAKFNISREQILAKWWEFANIDPAKGYNTSSQSRALELLWKGLGYVESDPKKPDEGAGEDSSKPDVYVAAWLREARGEKAEGEIPDPLPKTEEPTPSQTRPVAVPAQPTARINGIIPNQPRESAERYPSVSGGQFGRFQGS
jgi:hypothetical protein